ncbi:MAG: HD domain-containing protein [bacterium]|nr:HD domain-containing protein [bacterium]
MNQNNDIKRSKFDLSQALDGLSLKSSLNENLKVISEALEIRYADITRISVGIFDEKTNTLKAFLSNKGSKEPLAHLEANVSSLTEISHLTDQPNSRLVRHLEDHPESYTAKELIKQGYKSSYLAPIFEQDQFLGVVALSSNKKERFDRPHIRLQLDVVIKLIAILVVGEIYAIKGLKGTAQTLKDVATLRDNETGEHLERMSRYSRLIALSLATKFDFDDEFIEELFQCAPLHDIGKIGIPDRVLLKPGKLSDEEFDEMKEHTRIGKDIIAKALSNLHMEDKSFSKLLVNVVFSHHENWDGSGYPLGQRAEEIPIEARIVRVADVYDALTSARPYKTPWSPEETIEYLQAHSGTLFDPACVIAASRLKGKFIKIAERFRESSL